MDGWASNLPLVLSIVFFCISLGKTDAPQNACARPVPCRTDILPDPENCQKYYECNPGGRWRNPKCPMKENFDSVKLECMNAADAKCANACRPAPVAERDPCSEPALPCIPGSIEQNFKNCSTFYLCNAGGAWMEKKCQATYQFNPDTKRCLPAAQALCEETCVPYDEPPELPDFPHFSPPTITPMPESTVPSYAPVSTTINKTVIELACNPNAVCRNASQLPDPQDCTRFYLCMQGMRFFNQCKFGERFDAVTLRCVNASQATCFPSCDTFTQTTSLEPPTTKNSMLITRLLDLACNLTPLCIPHEKIPVPGNCTSYYWCEEFNLQSYQIGNCPVGEQFDIVTRTCQGSGAVCMPAIPCPNDQTSAVDETTTPTIVPPTPETTTVNAPFTKPGLPTIIPITDIPVTIPKLPNITKPVVTVRPTLLPEICEADVDSNGNKWASTLVGKGIPIPCPSPAKGSIIRNCLMGKDGKPVWERPVSFCVDPQYVEILQRAQTIDADDKPSMQVTNDISEKLRTIIQDDLAINRELSPGNLNASVRVMLTLSQANIYGAREDPDLAEVTVINIGQTVDGIQLPNNTNSWEINKRVNKDTAAIIPNTVDNLAKAFAPSLTPGSSKNLSFETFALQVVSLPQNLTTALSFSVDVTEGAPLLSLNYSSTDSNSVLDSIEIQPETLLAMAKNALTENLVVWTTYHSRLDMLMPASENKIINSRILALTVQDLQTGFTFHPPITLRFTPINKTLLINETFCSYWQYTSMTSGYWSQEGCTLKSNNTDVTTCECNHLTNFAVLVSPYLADGLHARILSIISLIGCLLSILGYFATLVFYLLAWKDVKSQHTVVLLNLCAVLIIANVIFLVGIDKVQDEVVCTVVAALLHYFWLVAFMVMLADGVMFILYVVYVFHVKRQRELVLLLLTAWFVPAIIVGVTLGVTRTKGYGTKDYCWLERSSGLIAAFIAPVCVILITNFVVLIKVLHTAATSKSNEHKNRSRFVAVVWNIMVVLPLLGIAWIFGLLSVNEQTLAFQYVFAIANSLQGLFIFLFHCALNKKLRKGVSSRLSFRGSTTSSSKFNKSNKSANLRNLNNKNDNGFLNRNAQEDKGL